MAEELQMQEAGQGPRKRKIGHKKGKGRKKMKVFQGGEKKVKMDGKMKKLFRKKVRDYNSDDSDDIDEAEPAPAPRVKFEKKQVHIEQEDDDEKSSDEELEEDDGDDDADDNDNMGNEDSDDEDAVVEHGIMKFSEGNTSFKKAFKKIVNRSGTDEVLVSPWIHDTMYSH